MSLRRSAVPELDPREVSARLADGTVQIIDVREPAELAEVRVEAAQHIRLARLAARMNELDRTRPVAFVCRSGSRSARAAHAALAAGFDAANVRGGVIAWARAGLPLDSDSKEAT